MKAISHSMDSIYGFMMISDGFIGAYGNFNLVW